MYRRSIKPLGGLAPPLVDLWGASPYFMPRSEEVNRSARGGLAPSLGDLWGASPYFTSVPPPVPLTSLCSCHVPTHPRGATPWFRALPGKPGTEATGRCRYPGAVSTVAVGASPCLRLGADSPVLRRTPLQPHDAPVQNTRWGGLGKGTHTSLGEGWVTGGPGIPPHTATPRWSPPCAIVTSSRWPARGGARSCDLAAAAGPGHPQVAC